MGRARRRDTRSATRFQSTHPVWDGTDFPGVLQAVYKFQSTHPVWDGTIPAMIACNASSISIHPSRVGWDALHTYPDPSYIHFNPPIPCGMGPGQGFSRGFTESISIHPSRVGWDQWLVVSRLKKDRFQSTHPVWDGTTCCCWLPFAVLRFQSTHPVWDGTGYYQLPDLQQVNFNPPIPCGMGQDLKQDTEDSGVFQSTHPVWDGTNTTVTTGGGDGISIHPSRVGWDPVFVHWHNP